MLHDKIGIPEEELVNFFKEIDDHFISANGRSKHRDKFKFFNDGSTKSTSVVIDKYFLELFKQLINTENPQTGAFSGKSIFKLLVSHKSHKFVLQTDIKDYFNSIKFRLIEQDIMSYPETAPFSSEIKTFYFRDGGLPIGLIGSPALSEIVGLKIDKLFAKLKYSNKLQGLLYSRYYDDIIVSSNDKSELVQIFELLRDELKANFKLELNKKKTRITFLNGAKILGLRFGVNRLVTPKSFKSNLRAAEHYYNSMSEDDLDEIKDKLSQVGTIIGSYYRLNQSSSEPSAKNESTLNFYLEELDRLKELKQQKLWELSHRS